MFAQESSRGLWRGMAVGLGFLVLLPALTFALPHVLPGGEPDDMFSPRMIPALMTIEIYGPLFPFAWMSKLSLAARVVMCAAEALALAALFGWLARECRVREQILYAMLSLGALAFLAPFLYRLLYRILT